MYPFGYTRPLFGAPFQGGSVNQDPRIFDDIFGMAPEQEVPQEEFPIKAPPTNDFGSIYRQILGQMENKPKNDAYAKFLEQGYPNRDDYAPTKGRRIGAIIAGATSGWLGRDPSEPISNIIDAPYNRAVEQYKSEGSRLASAAALEETNFKNRVGLAKDISEAQRAEQRLQADLANIESQIANRQITGAQAKANTERIKQEMLRSGYQKIDRTDGNTYFVNPFTGTEFNLGKTSLTQTEKDASERGMRGFQSGLDYNRQKRLEDTRRSYQLDDREDEQSHDLFLEGVRAAGREGPRVSPDARIKDNRDHVSALVASNPAKYRKYWVPDDSGYYSLDPKGDPRDPIYQELFNTLFKDTGKRLTRQGILVDRNQ